MTALSLPEAEALAARVLAAIDDDAAEFGHPEGAHQVADRAMVARTLDRLRRHGGTPGYPRCDTCRWERHPCPDYRDALADLDDRAELYGVTP